MKIENKNEILEKLKPMNNKEWEYFGYESNKSCCVCGKIGDCKSEPRFNYTVCQEHADIKPIDTNLFR